MSTDANPIARLDPSPSIPPAAGEGDISSGGGERRRLRGRLGAERGSKGGRLARYIGKRSVILIVQLLAMAIGVFVLIRLLPTDPVAQRVGLLASPAAYAKAKAELGLDASILSQLWSYLKELVHLNLGKSWTSSEPVLGEILNRIPVTLQLITISFFLALVIGLPLALLRALRPGGLADRTVFGYSLFAGAQPEFWWALAFLFLFSYQIKIFPAPLGVISPDVKPPPEVTHFILVDSLIAGDFEAFFDSLWHFALPCLTLTFVLLGPIVKTASESLGQALDSDFILHARARGLSRTMIARYALRNGLAPVVTIVGILYGYMLGGAVLIEQIFSLNGIGEYALERTLHLDFPSIQGVVLVMAAFSLLVYLVVDLIYAAIDPRIEL